MVWGNPGPKKNDTPIALMSANRCTPNRNGEKCAMGWKCRVCPFFEGVVIWGKCVASLDSVNCAFCFYLTPSNIDHHSESEKGTIDALINVSQLPFIFKVRGRPGLADTASGSGAAPGGGWRRKKTSRLSASHLLYQNASVQERGVFLGISPDYAA